MELKDKVSYDPNTGNLYWKIKLGSRAWPGKEAGTPICPKGRKQMNIGGGKRKNNSHVVWFLHKGYWPEALDHINGDCSDDRIENLRECTHSQNMFNRDKAKKKTLPKGVYVYRDKFKATIQKDKRIYHLGVFETVREASAAHQGASRVLHHEFSFYSRQELSPE